MDSVERVTEVEVVSVFYSSHVVVVVVWHYVGAVVQHVLQCYVPFAGFHVEVHSAREHIVADLHSVVLEGLEVSYGEGECLHVHHLLKIEAEVWIDEDVVHKSFHLMRVCEVVHVAAVTC